MIKKGVVYAGPLLHLYYIINIKLRKRRYFLRIPPLLLTIFSFLFSFFVFSSFYCYFSWDNLFFYVNPYGISHRVICSCLENYSHPDTLELYGVQLRDYSYFLHYHKIDKPYLLLSQFSCNPNQPLISPF